ncbi:DNA/RNA non-specific endonuclease [Bartonella sp. HY329]|uniref:DNA/RNA non-specific endonuclease n=1 Tax=unclassified Bartonella TaxID=2645622 RepID=UPI0021C70FB8|nr:MULTISPECIES: DNA/RNA non-specific endonuclease [unclassified Bartonella]UXM95243.1 DNA/RNA non-specific endonuclease [Bartonella sp. HY329]UXN09567.1 DNA/RNA non-specific endonuclease [Bartonella sp. HY328]
MSETAPVQQKPISLLNEAKRIFKGRNNVDMTFNEFLLHAEKDKQQYFLERLKEYQAMLHVIGLLAGVIGTEKEQKDLRDAVMKAIEDYIKTIKITEADKNTVYFETVGGEGDGYLAISWLISDLFGLEGTKKQLEDAGRTNHEANQVISQIVKDFIYSLWNSLKKWWEDFWKIYETEGLLIAINRLKIDVVFFVAETALDIGISVALAGAGAAVAAALKGLRFIGQRVGRTVTRVIIKAIPDKPHSHQLDKVLKEISIDDVNLDPSLKKLINEEKLGGASPIDDISKRQHSKPDFKKTTLVKGKNVADIKYHPVSKRPIEVKATIREDFGGGKRNDNATKIGKEFGDGNDDGGHLTAHRYFKDSPDESIAPQHVKTNRSAFKMMENEWGDWLKYGRRNNKDIEIKYVIKTDPPGAERPKKFYGEYEVFERDKLNPKEWVSVRKKVINITNDEHASFNRVMFRTDNKGNFTPMK